jgi:site-specific recombinase XerD
MQKLFAASRKGITPLVCQRDEAMLILLYATGMRREEIANLRPDQVDMDERIAVIRIEGKGAKEREVAVEGPAMTMLRAWLATRAELDGVIAETVFFTVRRNWWGRPMRAKTVENAVRAMAIRAELGEWGVHRFRVTFATRLHETIETTRRYIAVSGKQRKFRLKAHRQHEVLGTRPEGFPRWAQKLTGERLATGG